MYKKRCLIISDKPYITDKIRKTYEEMRDKLQFDADFASANCHVVDAFDACTHSVGGGVMNLVDVDTWTDEDGSVGVVEKFKLRHVKVGEQYRVFRGGTYGKNMSDELLNLVQNNNYDAIINACDPREEGLLKFWYTVESLGLDGFKVRKIYLFYPCMNNIEEALLTLNKN